MFNHVYGHICPAPEETVKERSKRRYNVDAHDNVYEDDVGTIDDDTREEDANGYLDGHHADDVTQFAHQDHLPFLVGCSIRQVEGALPRSIVVHNAHWLYVFLHRVLRGIIALHRSA